ncbi:MAG: mechanosensitive ion channel family protein [Synechococcus sp.]
MSAIAVLLSFGFVTSGAAPSVAQVPTIFEGLFVPDNIRQAPRTNIRVNQLGNLDYASVSIDGIPRFQVATEIQLRTEEGELRPIEARVIRIENNLRQIIATQFNLENLEVDIEILDDELSIFVEAEPNLPKQVVLEVTELDAQLAGQPIDSLAQDRAEIILSGILSAKRERQSDNIIQQVRKAAIILFIAVSISIVVALFQRRLLKGWKQVKQEQESQQEVEKSTNHSGFDIQSSALALAFSNHSTIPTWQPLELGRTNSLIRLFLRLLQISIFLVTITVISNLFPQSRDFSRWLSGLPLQLFGLLVGAILSIRIGSYLIDFLLQVWLDQKSIQGVGISRHEKRAPSIALASKHMIRVIVYSLFLVIAVIEILQLATVSILTVVGIAGLSLQSLFRDWISGFLVLSEDQFALGDVVSIENQTGIVEYLTLRVTKIRTLDGELISISNNRITSVKNLTNQWSRLNLGINVEYSTDLEQAIAVMESVALSLKKEPRWKNLILEAPLVLGVDEFGQDYITIRLLIKTLPMLHWDVAREYRLRLKAAFEQAGISFSFPLKTIKMDSNL